MKIKRRTAMVATVVIGLLLMTPLLLIMLQLGGTL